MYQKTLLTINLLLAAGLILLAFAYHTMAQQAQGFFARVPIEEVHTMRVWEDGSYEVVYIDGTSEVGCAPSGTCQ